MAQKSDRETEREALKYGFMERMKTGEGMAGRGLTNKKLPVLNIPGDEWEN